MGDIIINKHHRNNYVILDVCGITYTIDVQHIQNHGKCLMNQKLGSHNSGERLCIDCSPRIFEYILEYLVHGIKIDIVKASSRLGIPLNKFEAIINGFQFDDIYVKHVQGVVDVTKYSG